LKRNTYALCVVCGWIVLTLFPATTFSSDIAKDNQIRDGAYKAAILMNAETGEVLYQKNAHEQYPPASMVKMMLMLLVMEKLSVQSISLADPVPTSAKASNYGGSQVYLKHGEIFTLEEMMEAMVIHSANDAAVAVAEYLTGSIGGTVDLMNRRARELGLEDTVYYSVDGLPPGRGDKPDLSSAYDLAYLGRELVKYPKMLEWCSTQTAPFRDGAFILTNTNKLIGNFRGADGIKTGYYRKAGYGLTGTASRDGLRMISVVLGVPRGKGRVDESARLLGAGFNIYKKVRVVKKGEAIAPDVKVSGAKIKNTVLVAADDLFVHVRRSAESSVHTDLSAPTEIEAPVIKGKSYGEIIVKNGDKEIARVDALAREEIEKAPLCYRLIYRFF
jgi:D-alanyl-D-alanine carboxypeptidase (penicillin-binding protein 5/6)